jgi:hypothetical protein
MSSPHPQHGLDAVQVGLLYGIARTLDARLTPEQRTLRDRQIAADARFLGRMGAIVLVGFVLLLGAGISIGSLVEARKAAAGRANDECMKRSGASERYSRAIEGTYLVPEQVPEYADYLAAIEECFVNPSAY